MNAMLRIAMIAVALAVLAGCGNKGPLVLPTAPVDPATVPDAGTGSPAEADDTTQSDGEAASEPPADAAVEPPAETPSDGDGNG